MGWRMCMSGSPKASRVLKARSAARQVPPRAAMSSSPSTAFKVEAGTGQERTVTEGAGCVTSISSGTSRSQGAGFLDASENGDDVFFLSSGKLGGAGGEGVSMFDAHVCTNGAPCLPGAAAEVPPCDNEASCKPAPTPTGGLRRPRLSDVRRPREPGFRTSETGREQQTAVLVLTGDAGEGMLAQAEPQKTPGDLQTQVPRTRKQGGFAEDHSPPQIRRQEGQEEAMTGGDPLCAPPPRTCAPDDTGSRHTESVLGKCRLVAPSIGGYGRLGRSVLGADRAAVGALGPAGRP